VLIPTQIRPHLTHGCAWKKKFTSGLTDQNGDRPGARVWRRDPGSRWDVAFRKNRILTATLFSAYGGFLLALGALFLPLFGLTTLFGANALAFNHALGLPFLCWTISCGVLVPGVLRTNMAQGAVVVCLCLSSLFLAIGELANANGPLLAIGGWVGIICALLAWNAALGGILQATGSPLQLPMGERGGASSTSARQYDGEPAV